MSNSKAMIREQYAALKSMSRDKGVFSTEISWISNGRGYKHGLGDRCHKLKRGANRVATLMSPDEALEKNICTECFLPSIMSRMPSPSQVKTISAMARDINRHVRDSEHASDCWSLNQVVATLRNAANHLDAIRNQDKEAASEYGSTIDDLIRSAKSGILSARAAMAEKRGSLVDAVVLALMAPSSYSSPGKIVTEDEATLLGDVTRYGSSNTRRLYSAWEASRTRGLSDADRREAIARECSRVTLENMKQLESLPVDLEIAAASGSLREAVTNMWIAARDSLVEQLQNRWDEQYTSLTADTELVTVAMLVNANRRDSWHNLLPQVIEAHTVYERHDGHVIALQAPRVVATYLGEAINDTNRFKHNRVQVWEGVADMETVSTAIELWDPVSTDTPFGLFAVPMASAIEIIAK